MGVLEPPSSKVAEAQNGVRNLENGAWRLGPGTPKPPNLELTTPPKAIPKGPPKSRMLALQPDCFLAYLSAKSLKTNRKQIPIRAPKQVGKKNPIPCVEGSQTAGLPRAAWADSPEAQNLAVGVPTPILTYPPSLLMEPLE